MEEPTEPTRSRREPTLAVRFKGQAGVLTEAWALRHAMVQVVELLDRELQNGDA